MRARAQGGRPTTWHGNTLVREERAAAAAYDRPCPGCGHVTGGHRELASSWDLVEGQIVETPHPDHVPGQFHCTADGCSCVIGSSR